MVPSAMEGVCFIAALKDSCSCTVAVDTRKSSKGGRNSSHEKDKRDKKTRRVAWQLVQREDSSCGEKQMVRVIGSGDPGTH